MLPGKHTGTEPVLDGLSTPSDFKLRQCPKETCMAKENVTRKLAAILYAHVSEYRQLTGDDDGSRMSGRGACALLLNSS